MGFDQVADALGDQTRRHILVELLDHASVAVSRARERGDSEIELIHSHLPKLDSLEYISWNRKQGTIVKGPNWDEIEPVVRLLDNNQEQLPTDTFDHITRCQN